MLRKRRNLMVYTLYPSNATLILRLQPTQAPSHLFFIFIRHVTALDISQPTSFQSSNFMEHPYQKQ